MNATGNFQETLVPFLHTGGACLEPALPVTVVTAGDNVIKIIMKNMKMGAQVRNTPGFIKSISNR